MGRYHYFSLGKIIIGVAILLLLYFLIDPFADPLVALSGSMVGFFLLSRGASFFLFLTREQHIHHHKITEDLIIRSYKLSLLFGIYILFNLIFLLRQSRTVGGGIILLGGFLIIQTLILPQKKKT